MGKGVRDLDIGFPNIKDLPETIQAIETLGDTLTETIKEKLDVSSGESLVELMGENEDNLTTLSLAVEEVGDKVKSSLEALNSKASNWFTATIIATGTATDAIDLGDSYQQLQIVIPTITSAQLYLTVSNGVDGTFRTLGEGQSGYSELSTGGYVDTWELGGWRYIKINSTNAQASAVTFQIRGITQR